jgi:hypothetical protein
LSEDAVEIANSRLRYNGLLKRPGVSRAVDPDAAEAGVREASGTKRAIRGHHQAITLEAIA